MKELDESLRHLEESRDNDVKVTTALHEHLMQFGQLTKEVPTSAFADATILCVFASMARVSANIVKMKMDAANPSVLSSEDQAAFNRIVAMADAMNANADAFEGMAQVMKDDMFKFVKDMIGDKDDSDTQPDIPAPNPQSLH